MYRLLKEAGTLAHITLINDDTHSIMDLGRLTSRIVDILAAGDYKLLTAEAWNIEVTPETAKALAKTMIPITKPKRDKIKTKSEQKHQDAKTSCNAYDYLFGYTDELDD